MFQVLHMRTFLVAAVAAAATFFPISVESRPLKKVLETNVLLISLYRDNAPFSWEDNNEVKGLDADIGRALASKLGVSPKFLVRTAGEEVDDDIRSNIWQGPRTGGPKADVMLHIPMDKELVARNDRARIANAYYHEEIVLAVNTDMVREDEGLMAFTKQKVACQFSTAGHYFLAFTKDQAIKKNVSPYMKFVDAAAVFRSREVAGLMGRKAEIEVALKGSDIPIRYLTTKFPETLRSNWDIGMAVAQDSGDLEKKLGEVLVELKESGSLKKIFEPYGVTPIPPHGG